MAWCILEEEKPGNVLLQTYMLEINRDLRKEKMVYISFGKVLLIKGSVKEGMELFVWEAEKWAFKASEAEGQGRMH